MARSRKQKGRQQQQQKKQKHAQAQTQQGKKKSNVFIPKFYDNQQTRLGGRYSGILEINPKGYGFIRKLDYEFSYTPKDPFLRPDEVKLHDLRSGLILEGEFEEDRNGNRHVLNIQRVNGGDPEVWHRTARFELQTPIMPVDQLKLGFRPEDVELRVMDLVAPIGQSKARENVFFIPSIFAA